MRHPQTFILTLLVDDQDTSSICGRVRSVSSSDETAFAGLDALIQFIHAQMASPDQKPDIRAAGPGNRPVE